jgi:hypothetical protein
LVHAGPFSASKIRAHAFSGHNRQFLEALGMTRSLFLLLTGALSTWTPSLVQSQDSAATSIGNSQVEEIYVARAVRQSRMPPTRFCDESRIGFGKALFEDHFAFRSIQTDPSDGRMVSSNAPGIGNMHVCFGATTDPATLNFHAEGMLSSVPFVGKGECLTVRRDFPERGITVMRCFLDLQGLPPTYIGGQLTSNTVLSRVAVGERSDPTGYTQPSIVTVRLWKHR